MCLYDVFICHASEDKDDFVRPLAAKLTEAHLEIWYDELSLRVGDSLRRSIDLGLARSRYGVVVLSRHFFKKEWPQRELDGLVARETLGGERVILPVWHSISKKEICKYSPTIADLVAVSSDGGVEHVVASILQVVKPLGSPLGIARNSQMECANGHPTVRMVRLRNEGFGSELYRCPECNRAQLVTPEGIRSFNDGQAWLQARRREAEEERHRHERALNQAQDETRKRIEDEKAPVLNQVEEQRLAALAWQAEHKEELASKHRESVRVERRSRVARCGAAVAVLIATLGFAILWSGSIRTPNSPGHAANLALISFAIFLGYAASAVAYARLQRWGLGGRVRYPENQPTLRLLKVLFVAMNGLAALGCYFLPLLRISVLRDRTELMVWDNVQRFFCVPFFVLMTLLVYYRYDDD
jgi:hypothetical protein